MGIDEHTCGGRTVLVESGEAVLDLLLVELELVACELVGEGVSAVEDLEEGVVARVVCECCVGWKGRVGRPCCVLTTGKGIGGGGVSCCVHEACGSHVRLTDAASRAGWRLGVGVAVPFHDVAGVLCGVFFLVVLNRGQIGGISDPVLPCVEHNVISIELVVKFVLEDQFHRLSVNEDDCGRRHS